MTFLRILIEFSIIMLIFNIIRTNNPIHAVLQLIGIYFLFAMLLLMLQSEFLGFIIIIVNVGAVAVLFLFVIIMLEIKESKKIFNYNFQNISLFFFSGLFIYLFYSLLQLKTIKKFYYIFTSSNLFNNITFNSFLLETLPYPNLDIYGIGALLYSKYMFALIYSGLLLLIPVLGSITLVHSIKKNKKIEKIKK